MDRSEQVVHQYLTAQGFTDVIYEPDGKVTPDFLVNGRIAIEVRRLNQHEETDEGPRGLEHVAARLEAMVQRIVDAAGPVESGPSWFVVYEFRRPLPSLKELTSALTRSLSEFEDRRDAPRLHIDVARHFGIWLIRSTREHPKHFILGGYVDHDRGGSVLSEMHRNLDICLAEKTRKVTKVRANYPEWWFVLVDHIGQGLVEQEREQLRALVKVEQPWDKVILVDPSHPEHGFEL
jgi:hypothetical protein